MAAATSVNLTPTEEKADSFRLLSLIIDGGTLVLRYRFDNAIPPSDLKKTLNKTDVRNKLNKLLQEKVLTEEQWSLLFPQISEPKSTDFDIPLLACLLRCICGLDEKSWKGIPPSFDISLEADITRLRKLRNEISHLTSMKVTKQYFQVKWTECEQVLLRLGAGMTNLNQEIKNLKDKNLDPVKEKEYQERVQEWETMDKSLKLQIADLQTEVKDIVKDVSELKDSVVESQALLVDTNKELKHNFSRMQHIEVQQNRNSEHIETLKENLLLHEDRLSRIESKHETNAHDVQKCGGTSITIYERDLVTELTTDSLVSLKNSASGPEIFSSHSPVLSTKLQHMSSMMKLYTDDSDLRVYVKTNAHKTADRKFKGTGVLILSGLPGEGKTMMASKLLSEITEGCCLKLSKPSDWDELILRQELPPTIFIDDIFGAGALGEQLLDGWSQILPDIEKAVKENKIKVIITTRHYILNEAKEKLRKLTLFKDDNILQLASFDLSSSERHDILEAHLLHENKVLSPELIDDCCEAYERSTWSKIHYICKVPADFRYYFRETDAGPSKIRAMIGFPEIVSLFVRNQHLFEKRESFFEQPFLFFKKCMEELYQNEEKFLALILLWARPGNRIQQIEIEPPDISEDLKAAAMKFDIKLEGKTNSVLRKSLKYHSDGFIYFSPSSGEYSFPHNVIKDMVGLVAGKEYKSAVLDFADEEFILQFVTTDESKNDGLHIYIEPYRHRQLAKATCRIFDPKDMSENESKFGDSKMKKKFCLDRGRGPLENEITVKTSLLKHDCFKNKNFVSIFCKSEEGKYIISKPVDALPIKCFDWNCDIDFRQHTPVYLPTLGLLYKTKILLLECLDRYSDKSKSEVLQTSLVIASHEGYKEIVEKIVQCGTEVSENAVFFAAAKGHGDCLDYLLQNYNGEVTFCSNSVNKNSPLIAAAKIGSVKCIQHLLRQGANVNYRNQNGWSALDKAVLYAQPESCKILLESKARVNDKVGKFKRTPLHMNADMGEPEITNMLLQYGASIKVKDYRGHYPIHCAAIRGHNEIVEILLQADESKETLKHRVSYGKTSVIKGADLFHIAVYKKNVELINILIDNGINPNVRDFYGRTPIYRAVYEGKVLKIDRESGPFAHLLKQLHDIALQYNPNYEREEIEKDPNFKIIKLLLDKVNVQLAEKDGYTPLHAAVHRGQTEVVKLLAPFSNVNAQDKYGKSPLHTACEQLDLEIFKFLVEDCNADFYVLTKSRQSVFDILEKRPFRRARKYRLAKQYRYESPPYVSFRNVIAGKDPDFANKHFLKGEEGQD